MDVIEGVNFETRPDRHQAMDAAEFIWRSYAKAAQAQPAPAPVVKAELGPGLRDSNAQRQVRQGATHAQFEVQKETGKVIVRIIDEASGDVVRTIPPDELARLRAGNDSTRQWPTGV